MGHEIRNEIYTIIIRNHFARNLKTSRLKTFFLDLRSFKK